MWASPRLPATATLFLQIREVVGSRYTSSKSELSPSTSDRHGEDRTDDACLASSLLITIPPSNHTDFINHKLKAPAHLSKHAADRPQCLTPTLRNPSSMPSHHHLHIPDRLQGGKCSLGDERGEEEARGEARRTRLGARHVPPYPPPCSFLIPVPPEKIRTSASAAAQSTGSPTSCRGPLVPKKQEAHYSCANPFAMSLDTRNVTSERLTRFVRVSSVDWPPPQSPLKTGLEQGTSQTLRKRVSASGQDACMARRAMERRSSSDCEPVSCHTAVAARQVWRRRRRRRAGVETDDAGLSLPFQGSFDRFGDRSRYVTSMIQDRWVGEEEEHVT